GRSSRRTGRRSRRPKRRPRRKQKQRASRLRPRADMARKKSHPEHENHERWLVSYADFITLLFAFFVVMFASSQTDKSKAQQVADSVKKALEGESFKSMVNVILGGAVDAKGTGNAQMKGPGGAKETPKTVDQKA